MLMELQFCFWSVTMTMIQAGTLIAASCFMSHDESRWGMPPMRRAWI